MIASLSNYLRMRAKTTTARLTRMRCCARLYVHEVTYHGTIVKSFGYSLEHCQVRKSNSVHSAVLIGCGVDSVLKDYG